MLDTGLWSDIACLSMNRQVNFLLLGDFRQFPAVMDNFAGAQVIRELKTCLAQERFPKRGEPDVSLVISHAHRIKIRQPSAWPRRKL